MKLNKLNIFFSAIMACSFFSCEEDFDPNADYKETAIIYALIDASQDVQYVKVNKAFLNTNTNALTIAANNPDSTQFYDPIEVKIEELKYYAGDTTVLKSYVLSPVMVTDKEPGSFYYPEQKVYASQPGEIDFEGKELFRVKVTNQKTGKTYSAVSTVVAPICVSRIGFGTIYPFCVYPVPVQNIEPEKQSGVTIRPSDKTLNYRVTYTINYLEIVGTDTTRKSTEIVGLNHFVTTIEDLTDNETSENTLAAYGIYDHLNNVINTGNDAPNLVRKFDGDNSVIVKITGAGPELQKFIEVTRNYSAITQTRPLYTNVSNGVGLVSSRYTRVINGYLGSVNHINLINIRHPHLKFVQ